MARVTRRAMLGGTFGAVACAAAGCDAAGPETPRPSVSTQGATAPADPDQAIVATAAARIAAVQDEVRRLLRPHRRLRPAMRSLEALHRAHAEALVKFDPGVRLTAAVVTRAPETPEQALAELRRAETGLQRHLATQAALAGDGELARALASMSAGIAQWLTASDTSETP